MNKEVEENQDLRIGNCIRTYSNLYFDYLDPRPEQILIVDIAVGLSRTPRWGGQTPLPFSVAEHSIECYKAALGFTGMKSILRAVLLHDASEAYCCDLPRPLKCLLPDYQEVEKRVMKAIANKFEIQFPFHPLVKKIDEHIMQWEWKNVVQKRYVTPEKENTIAQFLDIFNTISND